NLADMRPLADANGFIPVYPQGLPDEDGAPIWNSVGPFSNGVDEIGFTATMIDALASEFAIDRDRVYATGYSNGANMTWELACYLSDRIAAIAPVAGSMWEWTERRCHPTRAVPVVSIHGTLDFYNAYEGAPPFSLGLIAASEYWVANAGADPTPTIVDIPDTVPNDGSTVEYYTWSNGAGCVSIEHYKVNRGGHDWPGATGNRDIDANEIAWTFTSRHDLGGRLDCDTEDRDADGVPNNADNCTEIANADQRDTDGDGFGNACDPDLNDDCQVTVDDARLFRESLPPNPYDEDADFTGDGLVNGADFVRLRELFFAGPTPGPGPSEVPNSCDGG
ncbi:MAG: hypothetical protein AAGA68_10715, partial [Pseudomonadota bacterium]